MRMGSVRKLTEDEIQEKLAEYAATRDPKIMDELVIQYANLVESIGRRFVGACEPLEDLTQEGYIGLIASLDKYDADKGVKFSTYATHFIIGQIKHYLRDKGKIIKEPAWLQELNQKMTRVIESLYQRHNRQPTEKEIGEVMQMPERTVREMLTTREVFKVASLDGDKDDNSNSRDTEKISDEKLVTFQLPIEDKIVLETALDRLKDIEQQVIADHFYKGLNQTEIAKKLGISCNYVSHILRNGTKKLKKILATDEIRDVQMQRALVSKRPRTKSETVEESSVLDSTTGLYSRSYFSQRLDEEISRAYRHRDKVALLLVNVRLPDDLESYVRALRTEDLMYSVGQSMRGSVRKMDVVARYSDTCFALILPHATHMDRVASRLEDVVCSASIDSGRRKVKPMAQFGMASYPDQASSSRDLLALAADQLGIPLEELTLTDKSQTKEAA